MPAIIELDSKEAFDKVLADAASQKLAVIIDFKAQWCGPCRQIGPKFKDLFEKEYNGRIIACSCDVDDAEDVASECGISAMPTFQVFENKAKVEEVVGADPNKLADLFKRHAKGQAKDQGK